jgi:hypothetical protein
MSKIGRNVSPVWLKVVISTAALLLLVVESFAPGTLTPTKLAIVALAVLPWLAELIETAELPGGWKFSFRELSSNQMQLANEVEALRFVIAHFLPITEVEHLRAIAEQRPINFDVSATTADVFAGELRHLRSLGMLVGRPDKRIADLRSTGGNVHDYLTLSEAGAIYLKLRAAIETLATTS